MTTAIDLALPELRHLITRPFAFAWNAWRTLTPRHFGYALLLGFGLGVAMGLSSVLAQRGRAVPSFLSEVIDFTFMAPVLLLCITVATQVRATRVPKWLPYVLAAAAAVIIDMAFGYVKCCVVMQPMLVLVGEPPGTWPGMSLALLEGMWLQVPRMFEICLLVALGYMYFREGHNRADALRNVQMERVRVARLTYEARLRTMQARVEPQFLFDTLGAIEDLYESAPELAEQVLDDLIVYLRAALPSLREHSSTLAAELNLARAWLDIMKIRLDGAMSYAINPLEGAERLRMPPMLILPLIDHALRVEPGAGRPALRMSITSTIEGSRLAVTISCSGSAFSPGVPNAAMTLVRERLAVLYGAEASCSTRFADAGQTQAVLEIPHEHADRDHR